MWPEKISPPEAPVQGLLHVAQVHRYSSSAFLPMLIGPGTLRARGAWITCFDTVAADHDAKMSQTDAEPSEAETAAIDPARRAHPRAAAA
jgi:hypothetical protein